MPFVPADQVPPKGVARYIPEYFKDKKYVKLNRGDIRHAIYIVRNRYQAKDKDYNLVFSKVDGSPVMRTIYYVGFDDGSYTTVKNDIVVAQIDSWVEPYDNGDTTDFDLVALNEDMKIRIGERQQRMGDRNYPVPIFEQV